MTDILQAKEEFKSSNFQKALGLFVTLLENEINQDEVLECCEAIITIHELLERTIPKKLIISLAENLFKINQFEKSSDFFRAAFDQTQSLNHLLKCIECFRMLGDVENAKKLTFEYLERSYQRGFCYRIQKIIESEEGLLSKKERDNWELKAYLASGNIAAVESWIESNPKVDPTLMNSLLIAFSANTRFWHNSTPILNWLINWVKEEDSVSLNQKELAKLMIDSWLLLEKDFEFIEASLEIAKRKSLNIFGHELSKSLGKTTEMEFFADKEDPETLNLENLDLGLDLLTNESDESDVERKIKFLINAGLKNEARGLLAQLERKDPNHPLVKSLKTDEQQNSTKQSSVKDLLDEISRFGSETKKDDSFESYSSMAKHFEQDYLQDNYEDIIVGLMLINLPQVAVDVIKRVDTNSFSENEKINLAYLLAESLIADHQFYKARDIIEDAIDQFPLGQDEKIAFIYLRAEVYYSLHDLRNALIDYKFIFSKRSHYRLVSERIRQIEEN